MQRNVGAQVVGDPAGHGVDLGVRIVLARYQQRGQFEPGIRLRLEILQRLEYGLEVAAADLPVEALAKRFQIDVDRIHAAEELFSRILRNVAGRNRHVFDTALVAGRCHIDSVFEEDDRVVVGIRHAAAAIVLRRYGNVLRRSCRLQPVEFT